MNGQGVPPGMKIEWLEDGGQPEEQYDMKFMDPRKMIYPPIPPLKHKLTLPPALRDERFEVRAMTKADEEFVMNLYVASRWHEVEPLVDWTLAQKIAFLENQHGLQHMSYLKAHPNGDFMILERENFAMARLYLDYKEDEIQLCDISVARVVQGQGLGSWLIRSVQEEGYRLNKRITLHVDNRNPAQRLYLDLGFAVVGRTDTHMRMEWQPVLLPAINIQTTTSAEV